MIDIYQTVNVTSGGKRLYLAVDHISRRFSEPSVVLPTKLKYTNIPSLNSWIRIASVPSLPIDQSLYPELFI